MTTLLATNVAFPPPTQLGLTGFPRRTTAVYNSLKPAQPATTPLVAVRRSRPALAPVLRVSPFRRPSTSLDGLDLLEVTRMTAATDQLCQVCDRRTQTRCSGCRSVYFCSRECQSAVRRAPFVKLADTD